MISYLADIHKGTIDSQHHLLKYALFISFFPQIIQGPIPRYEQLEEQLVTGHTFDEKNFSKSLQMILWGLFLKFMIANKASVIVNNVFDNYEGYTGFYVLIAGILYSIQLYTDFLSCVCISQGSAGLFGIHLVDNFHHPYRAASIKDFWNRWHISLSRWLRDYIYIPLGGNRKGTLRKYLNLMITFLISGFWHGRGLQFLLWGLLHGLYQVIGSLTFHVRSRIYALLQISRDSLFGKLIQRITTFFLVMIGWIIFRAKDIPQGLTMLRSMFTTYNPWILFDDSLFSLGLVWKEWIILLLSILLLIAVECIQEKICIRDKILAQPLILRWIIYLGAIWVIWVFGSYGSDFIAQNFIYGDF
ncbi:MAG: MBOAT family O-acyltransferase [Lachnospiraceae bacterium]|nr:MBOAT family protein [Lachnospiraceae bacterium]MDY4069515.1 MBOAT family O-acyltransferase [Lachnospiraceae bacterium]